MSGDRLRSTNCSHSSPADPHQGRIYSKPGHMSSSPTSRSLWAYPCPVYSTPVWPWLGPHPIASYGRTIVAPVFLHLVLNICFPNACPDVLTPIPNSILPWDLPAIHILKHPNFFYLFFLLRQTKIYIFLFKRYKCVYVKIKTQKVAHSFARNLYFWSFSN